MSEASEQRFELVVKKLSDEQLEQLLATVTRELRKRDTLMLKQEIVTKSQSLRLRGIRNPK